MIIDTIDTLYSRSVLFIVFISYYVLIGVLFYEFWVESGLDFVLFFLIALESNEVSYTLYVFVTTLLIYTSIITLLVYNFILSVTTFLYIYRVNISLNHFY